MTVRAALLTMLLLAAAAPVLAQPPAADVLPAGSLTVMSRPHGASFRLTGDQSVVGRTPITLDRGLAGRYVVSGSEIGYERWKRTVTLDGFSADTLWMTLKEKSAAMAGMRSLIVPGWGQFYVDHPGRGALVMVGMAAAGVGWLVTDRRYDDRLGDLESANAALAAAVTPAEIADAQAARDAAAEDAEDARDLRQSVLIAGGVLWGLSVLDAVIGVPRPVGPVLLGARIAPARRGDPGFTITFAQLRP
jgi:hypothetical protein